MAEDDRFADPNGAFPMMAALMSADVKSMDDEQFAQQILLTLALGKHSNEEAENMLRTWKNVADRLISGVLPGLKLKGKE